MVVLFVGLILSLTAGLVYVVNDALLPRSPAGLAAAAENLCSARHEEGSRPWRQCLRRQPRPASEGAVPFLLGATATALLGLGLVVLAARGRRTAFIPAAMLSALVIGGTAYAIRTRDKDIERIERIRTTQVPASPAATQPDEAR